MFWFCLVLGFFFYIRVSDKKNFCKCHLSRLMINVFFCVSVCVHRRIKRKKIQQRTNELDSSQPRKHYRTLNPTDVIKLEYSWNAWNTEALLTNRIPTTLSAFIKNWKRVFVYSSFELLAVCVFVCSCVYVCCLLLLSNFFFFVWRDHSKQIFSI